MVSFPASSYESEKIVVLIVIDGRAYVDSRSARLRVFQRVEGVVTFCFVSFCGFLMQVSFCKCSIWHQLLAGTVCKLKERILIDKDP